MSNNSADSRLRELVLDLARIVINSGKGTALVYAIIADQPSVSRLDKQTLLNALNQSKDDCKKLQDRVEALRLP
jgi:hypothetical protein